MSGRQMGQPTERFRHSTCSGATLHQKVVVTGVGDIWRARGARDYKGVYPPAGSRGRAPGGGQGGEAP